MSEARQKWTHERVREIHDMPFLLLLDRARQVHRDNHPDNQVQLCTLLSVKTGGCPEDCAYCPQSAHHDTDVGRQPMLSVEAVRAAAKRAKDQGATRFCMGAAWREIKDGPQFDEVLDMVKVVKGLGLEACCTLGMLKPAQAARLKAAGLDAYNHNIDTSAKHYRSIISTRDQTDRFETLSAVREAGITVCSGGIIGMGESIDDRCAMLLQLANLEPQPESVPINALVRIKGTPLENMPPVEATEFVRMIATARILMPKARVRLSAGRTELSQEAQLLCLYAGANSVFYGDVLLTTPNPEMANDDALLRSAGLEVMPSAVAGE
ncbi:MAG TPA: biotin synthase BioB [Polyangiaceae bacterium]|jgi:biotin synthase|nr:biotin synthase BioB [Polyangiaceae bacterium]